MRVATQSALCKLALIKKVQFHESCGVVVVVVVVVVVFVVGGGVEDIEDATGSTVVPWMDGDTKTAAGRVGPAGQSPRRHRQCAALAGP